MLTRLVIVLLNFIAYLPLRILYIFSDILFVILYYIVRYRRQVVSNNLKNSFPEKSEEERKKIARKFYRYMSDLIVETVKMIKISSSEVQKRYKFLNPELLEDYFKRNKSILAVAGHYGNWEMASSVGLTTDKTVIVVYKPLTDPNFEAFLKKMRTRFRTKMVPMKTAFREILSYRKELTISILVSDQTPTRSDVHHFTTFLNQPTAVFTGIEQLAKAYNYPVVFCDVKVLKRGYYTCEFVPLIEDPKSCSEHEITETHVKYLEKMIQKEPQYWIWSHKRWKLTPD